MKILLALDGSSYSDMATRTLKAFRLPPQTEVTVMTVVPEHTFLGGITLDVLRGGSSVRKETQQQKAAELLQSPTETLSASGLKVESLVRWGNPAEEILSLAHEEQVDLVVIGAKGTGDPERFPLGSVSQKVMKYADCSVLLAREKTAKFRRVLLAMDGSRDSDAVATLLLDLPLPQQSEIILLTAVQAHIAALSRISSISLEANQKILKEIQANEEREARKLLSKTKKQFQDKGYEVSSLVPKGEPAEEILASANTLYPDLIALGAKGLTGIETFLLGSVAQRVARFSRYSVLIGRSNRRKKGIADRSHD